MGIISTLCLTCKERVPLRKKSQYCDFKCDPNKCSYCGEDFNNYVLDQQTGELVCPEWCQKCDEHKDGAQFCNCFSGWRPPPPPQAPDSVPLSAYNELLLEHAKALDRLDAQVRLTTLALAQFGVAASTAVYLPDKETYSSLLTQIAELGVDSEAPDVVRDLMNWEQELNGLG